MYNNNNNNNNNKFVLENVTINPSKANHNITIIIIIIIIIIYQQHNVVCLMLLYLMKILFTLMVIPYQEIKINYKIIFTIILTQSVVVYLIIQQKLRWI